MATKKKEAEKQVMVKVENNLYIKGNNPTGASMIVSHSLNYKPLTLLRKSIGGTTYQKVGEVSLEVCSIMRAVESLTELARGLESRFSSSYTYSIKQGNKVLGESYPRVMNQETMEWQFNTGAVEFVGE